MEDSSRIVLYNSGGLPKTRCTQIRRHLIPELKPLILLLNETKLTSENEDDIEQLLKLNDLGYNCPNFANDEQKSLDCIIN